MTTKWNEDNVKKAVDISHKLNNVVYQEPELPAIIFLAAAEFFVHGLLKNISENEEEFLGGCDTFCENIKRFNAVVNKMKAQKTQD